MRIERLCIDGFGPLDGFELVAASDLVLVHGPNESGKTSCRAALETALFGFEPATRETHPLCAREGGTAREARIEAELRLADGGGLRVERRLLGRPTLRTASGGRPLGGARRSNRPLAPAEGTSRRLFRAVYSLSLDDLRALDPEVQQDVDDLLLPASAAGELRATGRILDELRRDRRRLWRGDRAGRPRAAVLLERLGEARRAVQAAVRGERELRGARREGYRVEEELEGLRAGLARLRREHELAHLRGELAELGRRRRELGPSPDLSALEPYRLVDPAVLTEEVESLESRLHAPAARLRRPARELSEADRAALGRGAEIEAARGALEADRAERRALVELEEEAATADVEARRSLRALLGPGADPEEAERARCTPAAHLRAAAEDWAREREGAPGPAPPALASRGLTLGLAGAVLALLAALLGPDNPAALLGALIATAALGTLRVSLRRPPRPAPGPPAGVGSALAGLAVPPERTRTPAALARLASELEEYQRAASGAERRDRRASALDRLLAEREATWAELCADLQLDPRGSGEQCVARLGQLLDAARARQRAVERDAGERREARRTVETLAPELDRRNRHLGRLEQVLGEAFPGLADPHGAWCELERRRREGAVLDQWEARLRSDPRRAELAAGRDAPGRAPAPAARAAPWSAEATRARGEEIDAAERRIEELIDRRRVLAQLLAGDPGHAEARARDEALALEAELRETRREHDRLALLETVLCRADREHRADHQPDVLARAAAYLARATGGRYVGIDYPGGSGAGPSVRGPDGAPTVPAAPPLSRGTLDQIQLCLRLGLLDHLDAGREPLPLLLDEVLVHWDDRRRAAVYPLLRQASRRRQVWIFTCHRALADEAAAALSTRPIALPG